MIKNNFRVNETHSSVDGRRPALTAEEEECIVDAIKVCGDWGFPFNSTDLRRLVKDYLDGKGVTSKWFVNNLPTTRFVDRFIGRHPELSLRQTNNIKRSRASLTKEEVAEFIKNWETTVEGVPASNIFNFVETNFRDNTGIVGHKFSSYCKIPNFELKPNFKKST